MPGLETNTLSDGIFHACTWIAVAAGHLHPLATDDYILWRRTTDWRWVTSGRAFVGWMLLGWGLFNLAEGIVDHHIHHVREDVANQWRTTLAFWCSGR